MARSQKAPTRRVFLRLEEDAAELLDRLAPSENKRGQYVSTLLRQAARQNGLVAPSAPAQLDLVALQRQLDEISAQVAAALEQQEEDGAASAGLAYAIASEEVLARDWLSPEDEEAWRDL